MCLCLIDGRSEGLGDHDDGLFALAFVRCIAGPSVSKTDGSLADIADTQYRDNVTFIESTRASENTNTCTLDGPI